MSALIQAKLGPFLLPPPQSRLFHYGKIFQTLIYKMTAKYEDEIENRLDKNKKLVRLTEIYN